MRLIYYLLGDMRGLRTQLSRYGVSFATQRSPRRVVRVSPRHRHRRHHRLEPAPRFVNARQPVPNVLGLARSADCSSKTSLQRIAASHHFRATGVIDAIVELDA